MEGQNLKDLFSSYGLRSSLANELEKRDIKTVGKLGRVWRRSPRDLDFAFNLARIDETKLKNAFDTAAKQYEQSIKSHGDTNYVTPTTPHSSIREKEKQPQQSQPVVKKSPPSSSKIEVTYPPIPSTIFRATQPQPPSDPKPPYQSRPSKDSSAHTTNVDHIDTMAKAGKHQHFQPKLNGKSPEYNVDESMNYGKRQPSEKSNFHPPVEVVLPNPQQSEQDYLPSSPPLSYDLNKRSYPHNQPFSNPIPNYLLETPFHSSRLEEATKMLKVIEINVSGLRDRKPADYDSKLSTSNPNKLSDIAPPFQSLRKPSMMPEPPPEKETKFPTAPVSSKVPAVERQDSVSRPPEILTRRASEPLPAWGPNSIANDGIDSNRSALTEMQLRAQYREQAESNKLAALMNQSKYDYQERNLTTNDSLTTKRKEAWVTPSSTSSVTPQAVERTILAQPYYPVDGKEVASQTSPVLNKPVSYTNEDRAPNFDKNIRNEDNSIALGNFRKQVEKISTQTTGSSFIDRHQSITESAIKYPQTAASAPTTASLPHQFSDSSQSTKASMTTFESSSPNNAPRPPPLVNPEPPSDSIPVQVSLRSAPQPPAQPEPYRAPSILPPSTVNTETTTKSDKSDGDQVEAFFTLLQAYSISSEIIEKCKAFEVQSLPKLLSLDTTQINRLASTVKPIPKKKFEAFLQAAREGKITGDPNLTGPPLSPLLTGTKTPTAEPATQYVTNPPTTKGATESNQESEGISGDLVIMGAEELLGKEELQQQLELENELLENLIQLTVNQAHQFSKPALEVLNQSKLDHQERAKRLKRLIQLKGGKTPLRGGRGGGGVGGGSDLMNPMSTPPLSSGSSGRKVNISNKITTYSVNAHHSLEDMNSTKRTAQAKLIEKGGSSKGGGRTGRDVGYGDIDNLPDYSNGNGNDNNRSGNSAIKTVRSNGSSTSGNEGNGATITKERSITEEQRLKEKQRIEELERSKMSNNASNSWKCSLCQRLNDPAVVQCPDCFTPRDRPTLSSRSVSTGRVMTRSQTNTELGIRNSRAVEGLTDYHPTYSATDFYNSNGYPSSSGSTYSMKRQLKHCRRCNNPGYEGSRCTQCSYFL